MSGKLRVGVLFGGQSGEHEVSLVSAQAVLAALDPARYVVLPIGIGKDGRWLTGAAAMPTLIAAADATRLPVGAARPAMPTAAPLASAPADMVASGARSGVLAGVDVVFPVLHGPLGEDGTVQGLLELAGVPYVGCGVLASAVGMDKIMMKAAFAAAGLPLVPWAQVRRSEWQQGRAQLLDWLETRLSYPMFVKPANMGSSVGISKVKTRDGLAAGLDLAASYDRRIVVEQGISAREIEVSVIGNETVEVSVPGEVVPSNEWYDYEAKYIAGKSQVLIPAPITHEIAQQVRELAVRAFAAVDGAGLARVDFLLAKDSGALVVNEVNTMPGFTSVSMYAKMWEASGVNYVELLDKLITLACERHART